MKPLEGTTKKAGCLTEAYAWVTDFGLEQGGEGVISIPSYQIGTMLLITFCEQVARGKLRQFAEVHARTYKRPVRLVRFTVREDVEVIEP